MSKNKSNRPILKLSEIPQSNELSTNHKPAEPNKMIKPLESRNISKQAEPKKMFKTVESNKKPKAVNSQKTPKLTEARKMSKSAEVLKMPKPTASSKSVDNTEPRIAPTKNNYESQNVKEDEVVGSSLKKSVSR